MKKKIIFFLSLIIILQSFQLIWWINKDMANPGWDQSWHLMISQNKYNQILNKGPKTEIVEENYPIFKYANNYYPPLYHISTIPFYLLFGTSYDTALLTNLLYLIILVISSYYVGRRIKNWKSGLLLAFIMSTLPILGNLMRDYLIDYSLVAIVSLSYCFLLYSENFKNKLFSVFFGISFGLGLLIKWNFFVYLIVPMFFVLRKLERKNYERVVFSFLIALIIASFWYVPRINFLYSNLSRHASGHGTSDIFSFYSLTYYLVSIIKGFSFLLFLFWIYLLTKNKKHIDLWNILFIYLVFTLLPNKDIRHIVPIFLFISISLVRNISLKKKKLFYGFVLLVVLLNPIYNSPGVNIVIGSGPFGILDTRGKYPGNSEINIDEILQKMNNTETEFSVCVVAESAELNDVNLPYYSLVGNYPVTYMSGEGCDPRRYDFTVTGPISETWRSSLVINSRNILQQNLESFRLIYSDKYSVYKMR